MTDILEGITANSPRSELFGRLRTAANRLLNQQDNKVGELQEIEERVRRKYANRNANLVQIIATSTEQEWGETIDFLDNFEDLLPVGLFRVYDGARTALGREPSVDKAARDPSVEDAKAAPDDDGGGDSV